MPFRLGKLSRSKLKGVHPDLQAIVSRAIVLSEIDFRVIEGLRTKERQKKLKAAGASTILNSRHITGHAIDVMALVDGKGRWDWPLYPKIAKAFKQAAKELFPTRNISDVIICGVDWKRFPDGGHIELARKSYPPPGAR